MNVLLVSQCSKNALTESRRILDQFAERRGDRTWQTPITAQGLETLRRMLRKTARKNTAVACHWIRGKDHSELLWIVGDARRFNAQGTTPTNTTARDVLRGQDENDWHTAEDIRLLAALASLFHDFGKANQAFQKKLTGKKPVADAYRHEWVSLRLFEAFVDRDNDETWLQRLAALKQGGEKGVLDRLSRDGMDRRISGPFEKLPPLARVVGWLIVSHHRLPTQVKGSPVRSELLANLPGEIEDEWCGLQFDVTENEIEACWRFGKDLPFASVQWRAHASKIARTILQRAAMLNASWLDDPYVLHHARMALMLADHYYSSQPSHSRYGSPGYPLHANTDHESGALKQRLDEHLIGVEVNASRIVRTLPRLTRQLPSIARHKGFRQRTKNRAFRWQDRAFDLASSIQARSSYQGFFGVNMASTGTGKTLANGRILYGLADPRQGARFSIALGLRTLTLQTGDAYRERMGLGAEDLAVLVGGGAIRRLHEQQREEENRLSVEGSESSADLLPEQHYVHFEGSLEDGPLNRWLRNNIDAQKLLNAPVLACTIDHLIPATEGTRGGRQIAPMLRLMSADLVLDEPDDFDTDDLPAVSRLVHWAGLLGSRVLLSSATLPPALVRGLFQAYLEGRRIYQRNRGVPGQPLSVCCAWFDEYSAEAGDHAESDSYSRAHHAFVDRRLRKLSEAEVRRRAVIKPLQITHCQDQEIVTTALARHLHGYIHELHARHHTRDPRTGKRFSFGLIRMANIGPLTDTAKALYTLGAKEDHRIHLCVYHAQHPLLVRSGIEHQLDRFLNRKNPDAVFEESEIHEYLDKGSEPEQIFVVLATAVAEVGRDHDYDWAVVEPSSMRSIIQLAGRVRRHRPGPCDTANVYLLDTNVQHLIQPGGPAFCRPGFESETFPLATHRLTELLSPQQLNAIDSSTRIREREPLVPTRNLVDLEHAKLRSLMLGTTAGGALKLKPIALWWNTRATLSGELQRTAPFRLDPVGRQRYGLLPDDDDEIDFFRLERDGNRTAAGNLLQTPELKPGPRIEFWGKPDYSEALESLAERLGMEIPHCARLFGIVDLPANGEVKGWIYHPALGFSRAR
ncbi:type I-F CRISPR-associated helicase Cas3f [Thioalbus denitrificans]|uniref:CRISPR-associated Cas3 family helicase n=1 Tax=Thioalbus denitrificans TaxID=547122 RepID=A0A369BT98_9GAMM|nr:type I-F CRISPR-associated helicase Cas3f [Thioalbus denitrificans]RCX24882.1 CRISPR-associated Cas3 family helicase [Thioalbus denitrificans]